MLDTAFCFVILTQVLIEHIFQEFSFRVMKIYIFVEIAFI